MEPKFSGLIEYIKKKKLIFSLIAVTGMALVIYSALGGAKKASADYLTGTVKRDTVTSSISASGMVEPVTTISLSFKNAEIVKKIYVKPGDQVKPGQLLAELESVNLEAGLRQAEANLKNQSSRLGLLKNGPTREELEQAEAGAEMAQATFDLAKTTLERNQALMQAGALSQADLDKLNMDYINAGAKLKQARATLKSLQSGNRPEDIASAEAQVESSRAQLQVAKNDLAGAKMVSPIEGIISAVNGAEGQRSTANNNNTSGGGFMEVISEALQVKVQVNEGDIGRTRVGQKIEFTVNSYPDRTFTGRVGGISPRAYTVSNVQLYDVVVLLDENYRELKAGMPANVIIVVDRHDNVLTVPKGAVTYAVSYLNKMRSAAAQGQVSVRNAAPQEQAGSGEEPAGRGRRAGGNMAGTGDRVPGESSPTVKETTKKKSNGQPAVVLVLDKSGSPAPRRVELGLSDLTSYEVISGLNEGDKIIIGSLGQAAVSASGSREGSQSLMPRVPGVGGRR